MKWSRDRAGDSGRVGWFRERAMGGPWLYRHKLLQDSFVSEPCLSTNWRNWGISLEEGWQEQWGREGNSTRNSAV